MDIIFERVGLVSLKEDACFFFQPCHFVEVYLHM